MHLFAMWASCFTFFFPLSPILLFSKFCFTFFFCSFAIDLVQFLASTDVENRYFVPFNVSSHRIYLIISFFYLFNTMYIFYFLIFAYSQFRFSISHFFVFVFILLSLLIVSFFIEPNRTFTLCLFCGKMLAMLSLFS